MLPEGVLIRTFIVEEFDRLHLAEFRQLPNQHH